jgi:hypothetical protein
MQEAENLPQNGEVLKDCCDGASEDGVVRSGAGAFGQAPSPSSIVAEV